MRIPLVLAPLVGCVALSLAAACAPASQSAQPRTAPQLTAADFQNTSDAIEVIIARKVPGVTVTRNSNGETVLRIRGKTTMQEGVVNTPAGAINIDDPQPLYVIDGSTIRATGSPLSSLSANDIESVTVLKGPDAAIYGTDALNGVIVIVTKRGIKRGP